MASRAVESGRVGRGLSARRARREEMVTGYLFLVPDALGLLVFVVAPSLFSIYLSFFSWDGLTPMQFVGLANYARMLGDPLWWMSVGNTALFALVYVPALFVFSFFLAYLVRQQVPFLAFFRGAYFAPTMVSSVIVSLVWEFILNPHIGIANLVLEHLGLHPIDWLGSTGLALWAILIVTLWFTVGYYMVIMLAALQEIPKDYHEAASLDGANWWQRIRFVDLPLIKPTTFFVLAINLINAFQLFDQVFVMTQGGPDYATSTVVYYIYQMAFQQQTFGYAAALAVCLEIFLIVITGVLFALTRGGRFEHG